jgi:NitT/TauT family transport system substrate-binding protein
VTHRIPGASRRAFLTALALSVTAAKAPAQSPPAVQLRVSVPPIEAGMEPYYALDMGFFSKAGLDVQIVSAASGAASSTAVVTGAIDIGQSTAPLIASAVLHDVPIKFFAAAVIWNNAAPFAGMIVAKDSPIRTARDFEGKTVGIVALHDGTHLVAAAWLAKNGADVSKVSFVETPFSTMLNAVSSGRVAGALSASPFMPGPNDDTRVLAIAYDALGDRYLATGYIATNAWLKSNRATAHRFATVMYETAHWANDSANRARSTEILQKYTKMTDAVVARLARSTFAEQLVPGMVEPYLDWSYRLKFHERRVRPAEIVDVV